MVGKNKSGYVNMILLAALTVLVISVVILGSVPPTEKDALVHHLAIPKLYIEHGGIYEIKNMPYSYYPMNLDLLYIIPLSLQNDIVPKYIHAAFALLTAWLVFHYLKKRAGRSFALLGALFFLSTPIIIKLSITVYVDLGLVFFSTAALMLIMRWMACGFRHRDLILSALCCGLAAGIKYNGFILILMGTLLIPFLFARYGGPSDGKFAKPLTRGLAFFLLAFLLASPWLIKNYYWTRNPVYPLYNRWFHPPAGTAEPVVKTAQSNKKVSRGFFAYRANVYGESGWEIALLPFRIFLQGEDGNPRYFDGKLNPCLLFLPVFAFIRRKGESEILRVEKKVMLAFSFLFFGFCFFTAVLRVRYVSPIIPPLIILSTLGLKTVFETLDGMFKRYGKVAMILFSLVVIACLGPNLDYLIGQFRHVRPFDYIRGRVSRAEYITRHRGEYPVMQYLNKHLGSESLVLFVLMGKRGYYCDVPYIPGENRFGQFALASGDAEKLKKRLKGLGVTHLLINYTLFDEWVDTQMKGERRRLLKAFFHDHLVHLFYRNGYGLSALKP